MNEEAREFFREQGRKGHQARLKKYGKKKLSELNRKAVLTREMKKKLSPYQAY